MMTKELYMKLLDSLGPTRLEKFLLQMDEGNTHRLCKQYGLSKVEITNIRAHAVPLLAYHVEYGRQTMEADISSNSRLRLIYAKAG
jgi:hypothetical protein